MRRRLFFLFPDVSQVGLCVDELEQARVRRSAIHAIARGETNLGGLPRATHTQRRDGVWRLQRVLWNGDLAVFFIALAGFLVSLYWGFSIWSMTALVVVIFAFVSGALFAFTVPDAHLDEFRGALRHGEILLMVDVPKARVVEIEALITHRHPEAAVGGVGWTPNMMGI